MDNGTQMVHAGNGAAGVVARQELGMRELEMRHETAATAVATQAAALVKARFSMALERPRSSIAMRQKLLDACQRPGFAEAARYSKPLGKKLDEETGEWVKEFVRGFSIRFAEEAVRAMGNIDIETMIKFDNAKQRIIRIVVTDLEANVGYPSDVIVEKTVERRKLKKGQVALSQRTNSYGDTVFLVEATEDEMLVKAAALTSKAIRTNVMRLLPGDIQEECESAIYATLSNEQAKDPKASLKKLVDRFAVIGVSVVQLAEYLGHAVDSMTDEERRVLIEIGTGIKEGQTTWSEVMEERAGERTKEEAPPTEQAPSPTAPRSAAELKAKAKAEKPAVPKVATGGIKRDNGYVADPNDTGPCGFVDGDGVVCSKESMRAGDVGYRCSEHLEK